MRRLATVRPDLPRWCAACVVACWLMLSAAAVFAAGLPAVYQAVVVQPAGLPAQAEFDLRPAIERARREKKSLYVYLGADDCPYCRRYEAFLDQNAGELVPHFASYLVVDLRSSLKVTVKALFIRTNLGSLAYADFQRAIGDERARMLVYPSVWLLDTDLKPLMQMPAGTGTFQTVPEQLEILRLVQ
ncbi:MAG: thioredoxin family protein [Pseudomonadota bacterium]|nr:thioredoxin family protein [Pseudomonadota bacterium]